jgi:formylglycine-generating enzyme required for sulfatase activity
MAKKFWLSCALVVLSVNLAYAVEGKEKTNGSPALYKDPATALEMVYVKGGCYQMGDTFGDGWPSERPAHEVCVDDFYIGKYEVTQGQWKKVMGNNPSRFPGCGDNCPVDNVSWYDAQDFIAKLNKMSGGSSYRLLTEAEFEYAERSGGKNQRYSGGNDVDSVAWYDINAEEHIHPGGTRAPNGLGIYDMSGNVWEWTNDWYQEDYYSHSPRNNPAGPSSGVERVKRGGCASGWPQNQRVFRRGSDVPDFRGMFNGFRLAKTP